MDGKKTKRKRTESDSEGDDNAKTTQNKTIKTETDKDVEMKDAELENESVKKVGKANGKKSAVKEELSDSESDVPLGKRGNKGKKSATPSKRTTRANTANAQVKQENKSPKVKINEMILIISVNVIFILKI